MTGRERRRVWVLVARFLAVRAWRRGRCLLVGHNYRGPFTEALMMRHGDGYRVAVSTCRRCRRARREVFPLGDVWADTSVTDATITDFTIWNGQ